MRPKLLLVLTGVLGLAACGGHQAQHEAPPARTVATAEDPDIPAAFLALMDEAREGQWSALPIGEIAVRVGRHFAGAPYEAGILDRGIAEELVVALDSFDCVLLVETALAAARSIRDERYGFDAFRENLKAMRYRGGELDGYCSRLHYFSEWIRDNEQRGLVSNVTKELGGLRLDKTLNFMSGHRASYPRFATNDSLFLGIKRMEKDLSGIEIFYIPQDRISTVYDRIESGDIIATATNIAGLDVSHTGLAYRDGDSVGFLHASTSGGVKVSPDLQEYVQSNGIQIGIVVVRPR